MLKINDDWVTAWENNYYDMINNPDYKYGWLYWLFANEYHCLIKGNKKNET